MENGKKKEDGFKMFKFRILMIPTIEITNVRIVQRLKILRLIFMCFQLDLVIYIKHQN